MLKAKPDTLFVFGDNLLRQGMSGQAREMRGEPNAVGIPTKASPNMSEKAFFTDADFEAAKPHIDAAFTRLYDHARHGGEIVWPWDGIGTGLAQLEKRAPRIWQRIQNGKAILERL